MGCGGVGVVGCPAPSFHGLLLGGRFARGLQCATGPKHGEDTRFFMYLAIREVRGN